MREENSYRGRIKLLLRELDLSQDEFAETIGVNRDRVNNWVNGRSNIDPDSILAISKIYGVSCDWILGKVSVDKTQRVINHEGYTETTVSIFFEQNNVSCQYCPLLETYARNQCRRTGEYILNIKGTGRWCPLRKGDEE